MVAKHPKHKKTYRSTDQTPRSPEKKAPRTDDITDRSSTSKDSKRVPLAERRTFLALSPASSMTSSLGTVPLDELDELEQLAPAAAQQPRLW